MHPLCVRVCVCVCVCVCMRFCHTEPVEPKLVISDEENPRRRITQIGYLSLNKGIVVAYADGSLRVYDPKTGALLSVAEEHEASINALQFNAERTLFITASADQSSKVRVFAPPLPPSLNILG